MKYRLQFRYNQRANRYSLNVLTEDGEPVILSVMLEPNTDLLNRVFYRTTTPLGVLTIILQDTKDDSAPGLGEIGSRVKLVYFDSAELAGA